MALLAVLVNPFRLCGEEDAGHQSRSVRVASLSILPKKWDKPANADKIERLVREAAKQGAQFVITPEGVLEGYVVNEVIREKDPAKKAKLTQQFRDIAEPIDGKYIRRFRKLADELDIHLILGFLEADGTKFYNTVVLIGPDGKWIGKYRKTHFAQGYEVNPPGYTPGNRYPVFDVGPLKVGMMICFDRTLPEPARLLALGGADLIACPAYGGWGELKTGRMGIRANENDVPGVFPHPHQSLIIDRSGRLVGEKNGTDSMILRDIPISQPTRTSGRFKLRRPETFKKLASASASPSVGQGKARVTSVASASKPIARLKALRRQRRIIYNDDSEELRYPQAGTPDGFLSVRLKPLAGTQVDTICWSVLAIWGDAPVYDSKRQPLFGEDAHGGCQPGYEHYCANPKKLIAAGHCPLKIVTEFAHKHGMEAFASVRMNDVHDSFVPGIKTIWKRKHPKFLVKTAGKPPIHSLYVTAQDYSHRAVRDRKFEIIEEVCERYNIDGVELDYIRHPVLFSSVMQGRAATAKEVGLMTSFMRRIRKRMDDIAAQRKQPLLLAARVPDTFELALRIGLDLRTWLKQDLVDILIIGGGYAPFSLDTHEIAKMAHAHDVRVYPCINWGPLRDLTSEDEFRDGARALAAKWLGDTGDEEKKPKAKNPGFSKKPGLWSADGIYLWNLGTSFLSDRGQALIARRQKYYVCLNDIGALRTLRRKDKLYAIDGPVFHPYVFITNKAPLPVKLRPGQVLRFRLEIRDDVAKASRDGFFRDARLRLTLKGPKNPDQISVRLNGEELRGGKGTPSQPKGSEHWIGYSLSAAALQKGTNIIEVKLKRSTKPAELTRVHVWVRFKQTRS